MYSSYPLVFAYSILVLYGIMGVCYEIYMGFRCGQHDCFTHLLVSIMPEYRVYFYNEKHQSYLVEISLIWKVRQQLYWGLGVSQILIVSALLIKIRSIIDYCDHEISTNAIRQKMMHADKLARRLYIVVSVVFALTSITVIVLSFPVMSIMS